MRQMSQEHFINIISEFQGRPGEVDLSKPSKPRPKDGIGSIYNPKKYAPTKPPQSLPRPKDGSRPGELDLSKPSSRPKDGIGSIYDPKKYAPTKPPKNPKAPSPEKPKTRPDGTPFNTMAPPPTGPGGDEALPRSKPPRGTGMAVPMKKPSFTDRYRADLRRGDPGWDDMMRWLDNLKNNPVRDRDPRSANRDYRNK